MANKVLLCRIRNSLANSVNQTSDVYVRCTIMYEAAAFCSPKNMPKNIVLKHDCQSH